MRRCIRDIYRHLPMDSLCTIISKQVRVQNSDITKTNQPFWVCGKPAEINLVNHPDGSISAAGSNNGFNVVVINKTLHVPGALLIVAGKLAVGQVKRFAQNYFQ